MARYKQSRCLFIFHCFPYNLISHFLFLGPIHLNDEPYEPAGVTLLPAGEGTLHPPGIALRRVGFLDRRADSILTNLVDLSSSWPYTSAGWFEILLNWSYTSAG